MPDLINLHMGLPLDFGYDWGKGERNSHVSQQGVGEEIFAPRQTEEKGSSPALMDQHLAIKSVFQKLFRQRNRL